MIEYLLILQLQVLMFYVDYKEHPHFLILYGEFAIFYENNMSSMFLSHLKNLNVLIHQNIKFVYNSTDN